ncbi:MAG TPA: putative glycoside hydrolase [Patescibacteria group bacterium]|nr:putative glycoside hydrolase [Patescibacteria group bacterium]
MKKHWSTGLLVLTSLIGVGVLTWTWSLTAQVIEEMSLANFIQPVQQDLLLKQYQQKVGYTPKNVKGVYLTAYSAGSQKKITEIINLLDRTELNAVVIDIKDYSGLILYDSDLSAVNDWGTEEDRLGNIRGTIARLHKNQIYVIARQTVFQDPILAEKKPEWAIADIRGGLWRDKNGLAWVDPRQKEVWDYNLDIAKEAASLGFDEINFDYVRFPSDGDLSVADLGSVAKPEVMRDFFVYLSGQFKSTSIPISVDFFGFVMERHDGLSIGQRLVDAVDQVDYICPMMYPSHYPAGHLGLENPAADPAPVIENGLQKGQGYFVNKRARLRPWLQAFNLGAVYDGEKIRAQIAMTEKYHTAGWLLWNAANIYTEAGLRREK